MSDTKHNFLFQPGNWIGEGKVSFSASPDELRFFTRWVINVTEDDKIQCKQTVEIQGVGEHVINSFVISDVQSNSFAIELQNEMLEKVKGEGIIDPKRIAWEFRQHETFEGFEVYQLSDDGEYTFHAEYSSPDQFRTIIDGRIWRKTEVK
ncbi:MAG: hypothetical protein VX777_03955 [Chlamydiota bacterium]|nr:hypothetical protein [Chlamydiota bacterium]